ncbi:MAG: DegV family protein [Acidimicrobiales bacterium]
MIAIVTDSASMLPPVWADELDVAVVPMTIVLDGAPLREGIDLDPSTFYRQLAVGATVSTSAPSPGEILAVYRAAAGRGASHIVSIHTGADYSAVLSAARVAAGQVEVPVHLVDSRTVSFPVALCVAAAARARGGGCDHHEVIAAAERTVDTVDSAFVVGAPDLLRRSGRLPDDLATPTPTTILALGPGGLTELATVDSVTGALDAMADHIGNVAAHQPVRIGVGDADRPDLGDHLADLIRGRSGVVDLVRYEIGPSVGAHSGAGTVGAVWAPTQGNSR